MIELDCNINDLQFAEAASKKLLELMDLYSNHCTVHLHQGIRGMENRKPYRLAVPIVWGCQTVFLDMESGRERFTAAVTG